MCALHWVYVINFILFTTFALCDPSSPLIPCCVSRADTNGGALESTAQWISIDVLTVSVTVRSPDALEEMLVTEVGRGGGQSTNHDT